MIEGCLAKKYRRTNFLVVLAVVGIALFDILYSYNQDILPIQKSVTPILPLCHNVLQVMLEGVHSYDGTHYGYGMNMIKAQYLLNYIHQTIQAK
ncbi:hypothetical protein AC249_AIPGENE12467 [Exaiptasia diaphana]|nr:hypothetical protein AC249_AIPGENE12467 [Exaiptasia diaphana]